MSGLHLLTERQLYALTHPCARASEVPQDEFSRSVRVGSLVVVTFLTVNK